ncbi:transposase [Streptomyces parvus]|uniref:transposase n=1 Tax=Streptomyces parvus TaxID=66428 RepID=UPI00371C09D4
MRSCGAVWRIADTNTIGTRRPPRLSVPSSRSRPLTRSAHSWTPPPTCAAHSSRRSGRCCWKQRIDDLTAFAGSPERHRAKTRSTNPPERINREVKRRTGVVQVFPNDDALLWLITAVLFELHDEWTLDAGVRHAGHGTAASRARAVTTIMSALSVTSSTVAERPEITVPARGVTSCARSCSRMATRRHRQLWARVERFFVPGEI